ncbi:MAG: tryptophan-rich sensory protein [Nocardioidaceae bacterium]|nr:tryptophan-rich sensory protein [Nocardioidaceae bacterium]
MSPLSRLRVRHTVGPALGVTAAAAAGSLATEPTSEWYAGLRKPGWQPPGWAFPLVWTPLYADIAGTSGAVLTELEESGRDTEAAAYRRALALNLVLNAGWSMVFFGAKRLRAAVPVAVVLAASSADLARRAGKVKRPYGLALAPYAAWTSFATVLNAEVARLNPGR